MFKAEFQPEAIALAIETADRFKSVGPYLRRLYADVHTELEQIDASTKDVPYVAQFAPARARECYAAILAIQAAAEQLGVTLTGPVAI